MHALSSYDPGNSYIIEPPPVPPQEHVNHSSGSVAAPPTFVKGAIQWTVGKVFQTIAIFIFAGLAGNCQDANGLCLTVLGLPWRVNPDAAHCHAEQCCEQKQQQFCCTLMRCPA